MKVDDVVRLGNLLDLYGGLLTQKQQKILSSYLCYDEGLTEIAKANHTTRQAVMDLIHRTCDKLEGYENTLGLYKRLSIILDKIPDICDKYVRNEKDKTVMVDELSKLFKSLED